MADDLHAILGLRDDSTRIPPQRPGKLTPITVAVLIFGAIVTFVSLFSVLVVSEDRVLAFLALPPYAILLAACWLARTRGRAVATLIVSSLATAFAAVVYIDTMLDHHPRDLSGLVFLFVPIYQLPAAFILLAVMFFTRARNARST